jgi:hypothetical protein
MSVQSTEPIVEAPDPVIPTSKKRKAGASFTVPALGDVMAGTRKLLDGAVGYVEKLRADRRRLAEVTAARSYRNLARQLLAEFRDQTKGVRITICSVGLQPSSSEAMLLISHFLHDESGGKILLVDDTHAGDTVGARLELGAGPGMLDLFEGLDKPATDLVRPTQQHGVFVLPMGHTPVEWLSPAQLRKVPELLDALTDHYAFVLVQQSAILDDRRHRYFAKGSDLSLLLVQDGASSVDEVSLYRHAMGDAEVEAVHVVLCCNG